MQNQSAPRTDHFAGFDGIRLVSAIAVLFSHAFLIAGGDYDSHPFVRLAGGRKVLGSLGDYGVRTFFVISGFLLARSLRFNPSIVTYSVNRTLRIMPAFAACALVSAFVIGPICTAVPWKLYFSSLDTWTFTARSLNEFSDWVLPGVFAYDGQLSTQVNGSLWSLRYEVLSYVFLLAVWTICRSAGLATLVVVALAVGTCTSPLVTASVLGIAFTLPFFAGGVLMHWIHARYGTNWLLAVLSAALFVVAAAYGREVYAFAVLGAYLVVFFGERQNPGSRLAGKTGDCSYGIYLYGWPAEQLVKQFTGTTSPFLLFFGALAIAWGLAFLSCHLVEMPAMKRRRDMAGWMRAGFKRLFNGALAPAIVGAKIAFIAGAVFVLTVGHWWLFLQSMGELFLVTMAGALIAVGVHRVGAKAGLRQTLSRNDGMPRETDEFPIHKSDELQSDKP